MYFIDDRNQGVIYFYEAEEKANEYLQELVDIYQLDIENPTIRRYYYQLNQSKIITGHTDDLDNGMYRYMEV